MRNFSTKFSKYLISKSKQRNLEISLLQKAEIQEVGRNNAQTSQLFPRMNKESSSLSARALCDAEKFTGRL